MWFHQLHQQLKIMTYGRGEMLKKKVNGSWSHVLNISKKTNGTWGYISNLKKKYNGVWSNVWSRVGLNWSSCFLFAWNNAYEVETRSLPVTYSATIISATPEKYLKIISKGSTAWTDYASGYAVWVPITVNSGQTIYIDYNHTYSKNSSMDVATKALLFSTQPNSYEYTTPVARADFQTGRQTVSLTPSSTAYYLYFFLDFVAPYANNSLPDITLSIYGVYNTTDSTRYGFN